MSHSVGDSLTIFFLHGEVPEWFVMTNESFDPKAAQNALDKIEQHEFWNRSHVDDSIPSESRLGPSRARPVESRYSGVGTEGHLLVTAPNPFGENIAIRLMNPLDPALADCTGLFVDTLSDAHYRTMAQLQYNYTKPQTNPNIVATTTVPNDFDPDSLDEELSTLRDASLQIDSLHDCLWSVLNAQGS